MISPRQCWRQLSWVACGAIAVALLPKAASAQSDAFDPFAKPAAAARSNDAADAGPPRPMASPRAGSRDDSADQGYLPQNGADQGPALTARRPTTPATYGRTTDPSYYSSAGTGAQPQQQRAFQGRVANRTSYNAADGYDDPTPRNQQRSGHGFFDNIGQQISGQPYGGQTYSGQYSTQQYPGDAAPRQMSSQGAANYANANPNPNTNANRRYRVRTASMQDQPQSVTAPRTSPPTPMPPMGSGNAEELPQGQMMQGEGQSMAGPEWTEGEQGGGGPMMGPSCGAGGCCGNSCGCGCCCLPLCGLFQCGWWDEWFNDFSVETGVQGFKSPVDQGVNGDFGFHEGLNWGSPLWDAAGIGAQVGFEADHSDLSRTNATDLHRNQYFVTAGLFHRPQCGNGFQYGLVYDYLNDDFVDDFTVSQLRGEFSFVSNCHEIGFWFTSRTSSKTLTSTTTVPGAAALRTSITYTPEDMYAFYYGHHFCNGAEGRLWGGFTGDSGGMIGADFKVPMSDCLALESGFNYLIPKSGTTGSLPPESWNLAMNLVWYPGSHTHQSYSSPYRPLFDVANNGWLNVNRTTK